TQEIQHALAQPWTPMYKLAPFGKPRRNIACISWVYPCETSRIFVPAVYLVDPLPAPAIAPGPEGAQRTGRPLVVDPFLVRAADDPVHHRNGAHAKPAHVGQDLLGDTEVLAHIACLGEPSLQFDRLLVLGQNDADRQLARPAVIRAVEGDRGHREAPKAFLGLLGQPLAGLLPEHAFPRSAVRPCYTVTQVG